MPLPDPGGPSINARSRSPPRSSPRSRPNHRTGGGCCARARPATRRAKCCRPPARHGARPSERPVAPPAAARGWLRSATRAATTHPTPGPATVGAAADVLGGDTRSAARPPHRGAHASSTAATSCVVATAGDCVTPSLCAGCPPALPHAPSASPATAVASIQMLFFVDIVLNWVDRLRTTTITFGQALQRPLTAHSTDGQRRQRRRRRSAVEACGAFLLEARTSIGQALLGGVGRGGQRQRGDLRVHASGDPRARPCSAASAENGKSAAGRRFGAEGAVGGVGRAVAPRATTLVHATRRGCSTSCSSSLPGRLAADGAWRSVRVEHTVRRDLGSASNGRSTAAQRRRAGSS